MSRNRAQINGGSAINHPQLVVYSSVSIPPMADLPLKWLILGGYIVYRYCVYIYIYVCVLYYIYIYVHIDTYIYIYICMCVYLYMYMYMYVYIYIYIYHCGSHIHAPFLTPPHGWICWRLTRYASLRVGRWLALPVHGQHTSDDGHPDHADCGWNANVWRPQGPKETFSLPPGKLT